ncbi:ankyrin [Mollisia scopiformis]|uniref:Ankyrin n=1 Tax=Mollisia scopiformis TaxID=149040 RepID=A0A194WV83_MOLSC|nr:ankyrin [Mollisia scopiformis]KUJ11878.1 ankyrin [Mollisia scopiformis]
MSIDPLSAVGPVVSAAKHAWTVWKSCKAAPGSFNNISAEVLSLHALLKEVEETLENQKLSISTQARLEIITGGCQSLLEDLQALVKKYESLGSQSKRTWDRLNWDAGEISELRARLTSNTVLLTAFMSTCQIVVEQKLNLLVQEFRDGKHEGSVLTVATIESLTHEEQDRWRSIRKELEDIGISVAAFEANKDFIIDWFQQAIQTGAFEEQSMFREHEDGISDVDSTISSHTIQQLPTTENGSNGATMIGQASTGPSLISPESEVHSDLQASPDPTPRAESSKYGNQQELQTVKISPAQRQSRLSALFIRLRGYNNAFIGALVRNDLEKAKELVTKGANINGAYTGKHDSRQDFPAICVAVRESTASTVSWLLDQGVDIRTTNHDHDTLLHIAARRFQMEPYMYDILDLLIRRGANLDAKGCKGLTPLCIAGALNHQGAVLRLLQYGADLRIGHQDPPLVHAVWCGHVDMVSLLIEKGADVNTMNSMSKPVLSTAIIKGMPRDIIPYLLTHVVNPNARTNTHEPLIYLALDRGKDIVALLIRAGADVNARSTIHHLGSSLLQLAILKQNQPGMQDIVELIIEHGADIKYRNSERRTALYYAVQSGNVHIAAYLLDHGANPNDKAPAPVFADRGENWDICALQVALHKKDNKMVRSLVERGADVKFQPLAGRPLLRHAQYDSDMVDLMLEHGADIEARSTDDMFTVLDEAVQSRNMHMACHLVRLGAKINYDFFKSGRWSQLMFQTPGHEMHFINEVRRDILNGYRMLQIHLDNRNLQSARNTLEPNASVR